jgi:hypothetical protein
MTTVDAASMSPSDSYGARAARRVAVVALYGGYAAALPFGALALALLGTGNGVRVLGVAAGILTALSLLACAGGFASIMRLTLINAANIPDAALDERWIARRNAAVVGAFRIVSIALAAGALYTETALAFPGATWLREPQLVTWLVWLGALLGLTLPTALIAWTEPDPITE